MKSTDLLNPGDFHQVTHQIRELVAYAISQLETAEQDGSVPSGKFSAFLADAAEKCPGYAGGPGGLPDNQILIEDGHRLNVDGHAVELKVADGAVHGHLVGADARIIDIDSEVTVTCSGINTPATYTKGPLGLSLVVNASTLALIRDYTPLDMHDQGGAVGTVTPTVSQQRLTDLVFTTNEARIVRDKQKFQLGDTGVEVQANILPDKTLRFDTVGFTHTVVKLNSDVQWGPIGPAVGRFTSVNPQGRLVLAPDINYVAMDVREPVKLANLNPPAVDISGRVSRTGAGMLNYVTLDSSNFGLKTGVQFSAGNATYIPTIANGIITKLESAS